MFIPITIDDFVNEYLESNQGESMEENCTVHTRSKGDSK